MTRVEMTRELMAGFIRIRFAVILLLVLLAAGVTAQLMRNRRAPSTSISVDRGSIPTWEVHPKFPHDLFTFARIKYHSSRPERSSFGWWTDFADADLNLSWRLHQVTALKVNPEPKVIEITDPELFRYPWVFMSGVGNIVLSDEEAAILRKYCLNGGFIMVDDFWGQVEWDGFYEALKQIFPGREPEDLERTHPLFHCVFDIANDLSLQTCNISAAVRNKDSGITWEDHAGGNSREIHFRVMRDDKKRIMMFIAHNTDNGDGWEEEASDPWFFEQYSEKKNYPLAINLLFYCMTH